MEGTDTFTTGVSVQINIVSRKYCVIQDTFLNVPLTYKLLLQNQGIHATKLNLKMWATWATPYKQIQFQAFYSLI